MPLAVQKKSGRQFILCADSYNSQNAAVALLAWGMSTQRCAPRFFTRNEVNKFIQMQGARTRACLREAGVDELALAEHC
eukprot:9633181-Karenia_brevis.AAC.1